jgi:hypothetical protein
MDFLEHKFNEPTNSSVSRSSARLWGASHGSPLTYMPFIEFSTQTNLIGLELKYEMF